jgi:hypothetical protein
VTGNAVYVFGIVAADHPGPPAGMSGVGGPGNTLRRVSAEATAAVIGAAPPHLRAKRRDLLAHQQVLEGLWRLGPVLPMRFGVVATDEGQLRAELVRCADRHLHALAELTGRAEVNVKVVPDEDALARLVAVQDATVRRLRRRSTQHYTDQVRLGEAVATAVQARAATDAGLVLRTLRELAVRDASGPLVEGCALNVSFLVELTRVDEFLNRVTDLDDRLGPRYQVRGFGPLPPYSFTEPTGG